MKKTVIRGSCLCAGVSFEVTPPFVRANHCHCSRCRKHSGTTGCIQALVPRTQFRLLSGGELIRVYGRGEGAVKAFCEVCGSSLFGGRCRHCASAKTDPSQRVEASSVDMFTPTLTVKGGHSDAALAHSL